MGKMHAHEKATLLGDAVFAANDGLVTTFAIIAGASGASLNGGVILILGFANLFADGLSMAGGNYLGLKSEIKYKGTSKTERLHDHSPVRHGIVTFITFFVAGLIPLIPYILGIENAFKVSILLVGLSLFVIGLIRGKMIEGSSIRSAIEVLLVGGFAALIAYFVGLALDRFVL